MSVLVVPMRVQALALSHPRQVLGPDVDHEIRPWFDGQRDRHADTPNLASAITAEPFADHALWLDPGVHLHWILPEGLTRGTADPAATAGVVVGGVRFPAVPNRWLVTEGEGPSERTWLVESDYVHPAGTTPPRAIAHPVQLDPDGRPWVHLGRQLADVHVHGWREGRAHHDDAAAPARYLAPDDALTAIGALEPTFAARYGNCHSVFGALDENPPEQDVVRYDVVGWYSPAVRNPLDEFLVQLDRWSDDDVRGRLNRARLAADDATTTSLLGPDHVVTDADRHQVQRLEVADRFGWEPPAGSGAVPRELVCRGSVEVDLADGSDPVDSGRIRTGEVAIGASAPGALAAKVAAEVGRPEVEEQLETLHLGAATESMGLDLPAHVAQRRHADQFVESGRRRVWSFRARTPAADPAGITPPAIDPDELADGDGTPDAFVLPDELAQDLHTLNELQRAHDHGQDMLAAHRQQLFADWHRFMQVAYPTGIGDPPAIDVSSLRQLAIVEGHLSLTEAMAAIGHLDLRRVDQSWTLSGDHEDTSIASRLAAQVALVGTRLAELNAGTDPGRQVELALVPGPRFWRPRDPVLCLEDPTLTAMRQHDDPGGPVVAPVVADTSFTGAADIGELRAQVGRVGTTESPHRQASTPWNPLLVEWQVEVDAVVEGGNQEASRQGYSREFLRSQWMLQPDGPDLAQRRVRGPTVAHRGEYLSGRSLLDPRSGSLLRTAVTTALERLQQRGGSPPDGLVGALAALERDDGRALVTFGLGGFHDGLLMLASERQLPIADPLGFADQRELAGHLAASMGPSTPSTPMPDDPFHPIRTGDLAVQRLRIVDTFGQTVEWRPSRVRASQAFRIPHDALAAVGTSDVEPGAEAIERGTVTVQPTTPGPEELGAAVGTDLAPGMIEPTAANHCWLPPRFSQGAQVDVRWRSAAPGGGESNDHPASSPVCGWLVPNDLEGSLWVYRGDGTLLGSVSSDGDWSAAPAAPDPIVHPAQIADPTLADVVTWMVEDPDPARLVQDLVDVVDTSLEAIDPADHAQHRSRAVLVGRPIAIVRVGVDLSLQGGVAATDQSWEALRRRLAGAPPDDHDFPRVEVPIRIGDHHRVDDGVVGFWTCDERGRLADRFTTPHGATVARSDAGPAADPVGDDSITMWRSFADPGLDLTLLLDPRAAVHVTTGIQPVKALRILPDQFSPALRSMRVTFATAPILMPADGIALPLPGEPGWSWAWLQRERLGWTEVPEHPMVDIDGLVAAYPGGARDLWDDLVRRGVIVPDVEGSSRGRLSLPRPSEDPLEPGVLRALLAIAVGVEPAPTRATFGRATVVRDGWIQLRPVGGWR